MIKDLDELFEERAEAILEMKIQDRRSGGLASLTNLEEFDYMEFKDNLKRQGESPRLRKSTTVMPKIQKTHVFDPKAYTWINDLEIDEFDMEECDIEEIEDPDYNIDQQINSF